MYKKFFGFNDDPFRLTPDPEYFYSSEVHDDAISTLEYAINSRKGIMVITGEVGTGKTTITRVLLNKLINTEISLVLNPFLSPDEIIKFIANDFEVDINNTKDKGDIFALLVKFLVNLYKKNKNALIIIDEAQHLSFESMEIVRQISNIEMENAKLVQILLVGQRELVYKLCESRYRQIKQRVAYWIDLKTLSFEETRNYVSYRVQQALRYKKCLFETNALKLMHKITKGNPREINQICEIALILSSSQGKKKVRAKHIVNAAKEYYKFDKKKLKKLGFWRLLIK